MVSFISSEAIGVLFFCHDMTLDNIFGAQTLSKVENTNQSINCFVGTNHATAMTNHISWDAKNNNNKTHNNYIITEWPNYRVCAEFLDTGDTNEIENLLRHVPSTGFGTVKPPPEGEHDIYPACAFFLTGFFFIVPWIFNLMFLWSRHRLARMTAYISCVFFIVGSMTYAFYFLTQRER
jgi:hypothetical protein